MHVSLPIREGEKGMQPQAPPAPQPSQPYLLQDENPWGTQPPFGNLKSPRGVTIGIAVELFGIAVSLFGLATGYLYFSGGGPAYQPNTGVAGLGALIAFSGLVLHVARV